MKWDYTFEEWVALVANVGTAILVITTISVFGLTHSRRFRDSQLRRPIRRALSRPQKWGLPDIVDRLDIPNGEHSGHSDFKRNVRPRRGRIARRRAAERALCQPIFDRLNGEDVLAADVVSFLLGQPAYAAVDPWDGVARDLHYFLRAVGSPRLTPVLTRVLFPDGTLLVQQMLTDIAAHLRRFGDAQLVPVDRFACQAAPLISERSVETTPSRNEPSLGAGSFAQFATALSGAVVLIDSVEMRSRYADDVLVWHRRMYRGLTNPIDDISSKSTGDRPPVPRWESTGSPAVESSDGYRVAHRSDGQCACGTDASQRMVGDFDRRVLTLRSVSLGESSEQGRVSFVLETSETCYAATEQGDMLLPADAPSWRRVGCKHLSPAAGVAGSKQLHVPEEGPYKVSVLLPDQGPVMLLTTYVSLITCDGELVLTRRSGQVRHGADVISATAGGILEPDGHGQDGDVDAFGMPNPLSAAIRETMEEIGVDLTSHPVRPVCVFLANSRNQSGSRRGRGQLVAVVLFLATVPDTAEELGKRLQFADPSLGRFEVDHFEVVGRSAPCSTSRNESFSESAARFARARAASLDQHGLLSCLYTSAVLDGAEKARAAFESAFNDQPWWSIGGTSSDSDSTVIPRVVRDPRALLSVGGGLIPTPLELVVPSWVQWWDDLQAQLDLARRLM